MSTREEIITQVGDLVRRTFNGDYHAAFTHYDADGGSLIDTTELIHLLTDAGVGTRFTRGMMARGVIAALDRNDDGQVSWDEFETAFKAAR